MFIKFITLVSVLACVAAAGNQWAWKNVAEPQCNDCKCYRQAPQMEIKPLRSLFAKKRYALMGNKLYLVQLHIGLGNRGMIKTDQDLAAIAPLTFNTYFSRGMKRAYANWTLAETVTGSIASRIRGNVLHVVYETGMSRKIKNIEDSIMGAGLVNIKVLWADKTNVLVIACFGSKGYSGWLLFSTSRALRSTTEKIVLEKISQIGFNPKRPVVLPYSK